MVNCLTGITSFALYINDLPIVILHSLLDLYTDLSIVESFLQFDLDAVACWLCSSQLSLNAVKSSSMLIGSRQKIVNNHLMFQL